MITALGAGVGMPAEDLPQAEFGRRLKRLLSIQRRRRLDGVLIFTPVNRYYFTGVTASNGLIAVTGGDTAEFFTDFRYLVAARRQLEIMPTMPIWRAGREQDFFRKLGSGWQRVGYEGAIDAARFNRLREALPSVEWVDITSDIAALRSIKSAAEQRVIRGAVAANDRLYAAIMQQVRPGMSEWEIRSLVRQGADIVGQGEAFDTIPCVGRNAAECHHTPDQSRLKKGQPLLLDMGVRYNHYCSDLTRTVVFGKPSPLLQKIHNIVLEANQRAISGIRPGRECSEIDAIARDYITEAGYGDNFGHSLGHSLGLEIHESPNFAATCKTVLKPGMVLTVEPGIYLPGRLGVRIEDVVLVTRTGCEVLSASPRELAALGAAAVRSEY